MTSNDLLISCTLLIAYVFTAGMLYALPPIEPLWPDDIDRFSAAALWPIMGPFLLLAGVAILGARTTRALVRRVLRWRADRDMPRAREVRRG